MTLRQTSLLLNFIVLALSLSFFSYTFFAQAHLTQHTRAVVIEETIARSQPLLKAAKAAESVLESPLGKLISSKGQREKFQNEIALYEADPAEYLTALIANRQEPSGKGKIAAFKTKIYRHYQSVLDALIRDLRIFSGTNIVASTVALCLLLWKAPEQNLQKALIILSFTIFIIVAYSTYSTYSYLADLSFLKILLKWHLGWWYPAGIALELLRQSQRILANPTKKN